MVLLTIKNLRVRVGDKLVLDGINLSVSEGEVQVLMGANGSGKSSLANVLMGNPNYIVQAWRKSQETKVEFEGANLLSLSSDQRARLGLYVSWQNPVIIPGVSVFSLCKASYEVMGKKIEKLTEFKHKLEELAARVGLTKEYIGRAVNEGFSGGERKRLELLQLLLLKPKLAILDEIDSGLDVSGRKIVTKTINEMKEHGTTFILITHNKTLLDEVAIDKVCEMKYGRIPAGV